MSPNHAAVRAVAQTKLRGLLEPSAKEKLTPEAIASVVREAVQFLGANDVDADAVIADLEASFQTVIGQERTLLGADENYEPWLPKQKSDIAWRFWDRYQQNLRESNWPETVIQRLDASTDAILGLLNDPKQEGGWDRRGMVVGHVQSGKTANYVGTICKAADAGYKVIIVLAGFHNSLRAQTQVRLEEGFLGYDRAAYAANPDKPVQPIGVGLISPDVRANSITNRTNNGDFKRSTADTFGINPGGRPLLFVIKKNASVLKNLLNWVRSTANAKDSDGNQYVKGIPLLVIDDEADQGSIDTQQGAFTSEGKPDPDHDPSKLNRQIRKLLHLFDQSAYVGYTATPFANIFIHERGRTKRDGEDLFPRSFIISLPTPSSYFGPSRVFGTFDEDGNLTEGLPITRTVRDHADTLLLDERRGWMPPKHNKSHLPRYEDKDELPDSLREALLSFVLVCAARLSRGQESAHNSMLVHVTRFTDVQGRVKDQVETALTKVQRRLRYGDGEGDSLTDELRRLWEEDFRPTTRAVGDASCPDNEWAEIAPHLAKAALSVEVREINGSAGEVLDYVNHAKTGLNVIAIGGDKLSRGLTLEGLSISYFLRASRMYDTLMQMGRWFGYRPGYVDLCRLYTTPDIIEWFGHIATASEELREDFDRMAASGGTPRDFGHRVRSHPLMMVTSQVKMRHGQRVDVTFQGAITETINFYRTREHLDPNWKAAENLIEEIERQGAIPIPVTRKDTPAEEHVGAWKWAGARAEAVVGFLNAYMEHPQSKRVKTSLLVDYIRKEVREGRLTDWTVFLASGTGQEDCVSRSSFRRVTRSWHFTSSTPETKLAEWNQLRGENHYRIRRLVSPADETVDLTSDQVRDALKKTREEWQSDPERKRRQKKEPSRPSGPNVRMKRSAKQGLLLLYPLSPEPDKDEESCEETERLAKVEPEALNQPVLGFAISFPFFNPERASRVTYVVNNVYAQQEFSFMHDSEGSAD